MRTREIGKAYWCNTLSIMGISVAAIFVPIFLLKSGVSFISVLEYMLLQQVFAAIAQYPASRLFRFMHPHHILAVGALMYGVFFGLLISFGTHHWSLGLLAFVWSLNRAMYWAAFHYIFSSARTHKTSGRQIAGFEALALMAATIAPAIGGIVASLFGINYVYVIAILLVIVASVPLFSTEGEPPMVPLHLSWHEFKAMRRDALANAFNGIVMIAELNVWPLLIFTLVSTYAGVGILSSVIAISTVLVTLYVGRRQETRGEHHYIKQGLATYSLTSLGRALAQNVSQVFGLNLLGGIGRSLYTTPFMNRYYHNSDGPHRLGYITIMESAFSLGSAAFTLILLLLAVLVSMKVVLAIALALVAICTLGVRLIR